MVLKKHTQKKQANRNSMPVYFTTQAWLRMQGMNQVAQKELTDNVYLS